MRKLLFICSFILAFANIYGQSKSELQKNNIALKDSIEKLNYYLNAKNIRIKYLESQIKEIINITSDLELSNTDSVSTEPVMNNQCKAITVKGTRCKRTAEFGKSYCWQHRDQSEEPSEKSYKSSSSSEKSYNSSSSSYQILTGPRGGKYYINSHGNKTYIKRK